MLVSADGGREEGPTAGSEGARIDVLTAACLPAPGKTSLVNVLAVSAIL